MRTLLGGYLAWRLLRRLVLLALAAAAVALLAGHAGHVGRALSSPVAVSRGVRGAQRSLAPLILDGRRLVQRAVSGQTP